MRRAWVLLFAAVALAVVSSPASAAEPAATTVTYVTGSTVYIGAGADDGLQPGDRVEVVREGTVVATLEVEEVSNHRATCRRIEGQAETVLGDSIRFTPGPTAAAPTTALPASAADPAPAGRSGTRRDRGIHGRIGVQFLAVANRDNDVADFNQPGVTLRFDGTRLGGTGVHANVDIRSRRTTRTGSTTGDKVDTQNRVYTLSAGYTTRSGIDLTLGRQYSPNLASVNTFDGVAVHYGRNRWSVGGFGGAQPEFYDSSFSSDTRAYGGYFQLRGSRESRKRWQLAVGAVGSYEESEVNREFVFVQLRYVAPKLSAFGVTEIDLNRGWKSEFEDQTVSPTNAFVSLRYQASPGVGLVGGYDNRRRVRLYRDRITPETEFDDAFRQGIWIGTVLNAGQSVRLDVNARDNSGGSAGTARTYTVGVGFGPFARRGFYVRSRGTRFENDYTEGWLGSASLAFDVAGRVQFSLDGGVRQDRALTPGSPDVSLVWYGIEADVPIGRRWFYLIALERTDGDWEQIEQIYTLLTYRF
jgi:hypothetical protein